MRLGWIAYAWFQADNDRRGNRSGAKDEWIKNESSIHSLTDLVATRLHATFAFEQGNYDNRLASISKGLSI
jgi:hypothetical protein